MIVKGRYEIVERADLATLLGLRVRDTSSGDFKPAR